MPVDKFGRTDSYSIQAIVTGGGGGITIPQANDFFLRRDGENSATKDINLNSHKLINVLDPVQAQDAATKNYVDANAGPGFCAYRSTGFQTRHKTPLLKTMLMNEIPRK